MSPERFPSSLDNFSEKQRKWLEFYNMLAKERVPTTDIPVLEDPGFFTETPLENNTEYPIPKKLPPFYNSPEKIAEIVSSLQEQAQKLSLYMEKCSEPKKNHKGEYVYNLHIPDSPWGKIYSFLYDPPIQENERIEIYTKEPFLDKNSAISYLTSSFTQICLQTDKFYLKSSPGGDIGEEMRQREVIYPFQQDLPCFTNELVDNTLRMIEFILHHPND